MRIGLVTGEYPPDQGGVGDFTCQLGQALSELGHRVHVITGQPQSAVGRDPDSPASVYRVVSRWGWGCWPEVLQQAQALQLDVLNLQYQAAAYRMHPAVNFVPRRGQRPPVVVTFHDLKVPYLFPKAGPLRWQVVRLLMQRADGVIVTNQEDYLRLENEPTARRRALIPIGSNILPALPAGYDRQAERARWGVQSGDLLLGYFGFLNESKGGEELIRALAALVKGGTPAHLLLIGGRVGSSDPTNQDYARRVDQLIDALGLRKRVHRTDYAAPQQVSAGLLATDVCVLPYRDGISFRRGTLHACLAHRRAVVSTRPTLPLPELRDGENVLLAPPGDPEALAAAVSCLSADPALRARLEAGAAALAEEFTWERIARQTAAFFGRV